MKTVFLDFDSLGPDDVDTSELAQHLDDTTFWPDTADADVVARLQDAEVAVINKIVLDSATLDALPGLKLVCLAATGSDNIDLNAARELGIAVANIRDYCTPSVVQHVFALILSLTQSLAERQEAIRAGRWQTSDEFCLLQPTFRELHGKTMGLVGMGALGSGVAGVARAFGMRVVAARLPWRSTLRPGAQGQSAPRLPLHELLPQSDVVSLHCPLTPDTRGLIDAAALELMRHDALLINTARGALVDSAALAEALQQGSIGGAGIDVLEDEPPVRGDPLLDLEMPNLIITPHVAWSAVEARQRALDEILSNIQSFARGIERNRLC